MFILSQLCKLISSKKEKFRIFLNHFLLLNFHNNFLFDVLRLRLIITLILSLLTLRLYPSIIINVENLHLCIK